MEREDGEMSDDHEMLVDDGDELLQQQKKRIKIDNECTVMYKAEKDGLLIKHMEKVDAAKLEERAKRFGLNLSGNRVITQRQIDELYNNFGIEGDNQRHFRLDALYLNGVDGMTTKEIFEYLEDYKPISLEWIDEVSCNIVCQDHISAALALLVHSSEIRDQELKEMLAEKSSHHWRLGAPHPKKDVILMRFATNGEKKKLNKVKKPIPKDNDVYYDQTFDSVSKNPWGDLCRSWGVYDHQEVFNRKLTPSYSEEETEPQRPVQVRNKKLAMRLGKRQHQNVKESSEEESGSDSEWKSKSKTPRMRMHADDEESKIKKQKSAKIAKEITKPKDKYAPLSIEVVNADNEFIKREPTRLSDKFRFHGVSNHKSIQSRLGDKVIDSNEHCDQNDESNDSAENMSDSEQTINIMSKVQKVSSKNNNSSVWSRLDVNQRSMSSRLGSSVVTSQTDTQNDLRSMLKHKSQPSKSNDLRERLGKSKQANLRIEIDNK